MSKRSGRTYISKPWQKDEAPGSIESFVKKLQSEGVDAGRKAAEKIKGDAKQEAEKIIAQAEAEAERIVAKAKNEADKYFSRMQTELDLAVRDAILKLRETIGQILSAMLTRKIEKHLSNPDFLGKIIKEVIMVYAKADAAQQPFMKVDISGKMGDKLGDDILNDLFAHLNEEQEKIALQATLSKAGFEYTIDGATVDVSPDSVSEVVLEMVRPALQEIIDRVVD